MVDHEAIRAASALEKKIKYIKDNDKSRFKFSKNNKFTNYKKGNVLVILPIIKLEISLIL